MPYILPATHASRISAGEQLPEQDRQVQECLSVIEVAIRQKASEGLNKVHLLHPRFAGWDKNNLSSGPVYMSAVFDALLSNGYGFFTEPGVPVHESMGPMMIPYVHTSVTWGKMAIFDDKTQSDNARGVMPPPASPGNLQRKLQESYQVDYADTKVTWPDAEVAKRIKEAHESVDFVVGKPADENPVPKSWLVEPNVHTPEDLGADEAYFREYPSAVPQTDPMPGHPAQLINCLRKRGFALKDFGANSLPQPMPPYTAQTGRLIHTLTREIFDAHLRGSRGSRADVSFDPVGVDLSRVQKEFSSYGFHFTRLDTSGSVSFWWPQNAWDKFEPAPIPAAHTPDMPPESSKPRLGKPVDAPVSRIGKFVVALRQSGFDLAPSEGSFSQDLLDRQGFEDDILTGKAYENVLECLLESVKKGESALRMKLTIDCRIGRISEYLRPLGFACDWTVHAYARDEPAHQLLTIKWRAVKC